MANAAITSIEALLADDDVVMSDDQRAQMEASLRLLRTGSAEEIAPPNIPSNEPIPGQDPKADALRAASETGDLPRPEQEIMPSLQPVAQQLAPQPQPEPVATPMPAPAPQPQPQA